MAKKKQFGDNAETNTNTDGKMAKVIISTKLGNNKYAFKESIINQNNVKEYIAENKS